ncbi:MAG: valine--tRNA ligase [Acidobacteriota bacterium]|jgi:valyl-tRNA synthetase
MTDQRKPAPSDAGEMPKGYEPEEVEPRWEKTWEERAVGTPDPASDAPVYAMVIPPPNVTGSLHLGHALDHTIQDIMARWKRMQGHDVLWLPGTDHAGIATQNVVEKQLAAEGTSRLELGRGDFEHRVWQWKEESGGRITEQMRREGLTVDWTRERFTLDEGLSRAVRRVFVDLYEQGLIYRGEYLVNWCPRCGTAISDLEVKHHEGSGSLWKIRYPLKDEEGFVEVETTRPETMLGDTALAVNPDDERYTDLVGKTAVLPIIGRELPIIADAFVDRQFGTGVVKVTPAHDPNDYEAGLRHELERVEVIGRDGTMTRHAGEFAGQDRFAARKNVVARLEADGNLVSRKDHQHAVGHCDRCDTIIEPLVSLQWFVRMKPLAEPALAAVEEGRIRFVPDHTIKVYREWMTNIRDWCISRQLWWGHRIPAWYCDACGKTIVSTEEPAACECGGELRQETDVLDTWFSSGLFPFSTLGWPDDTEDLRRYYPGALLVTAYDIIFFWVARMIFFGLHFMDEVPFHDVFFHGLVRDEKGQKMSKSRGNVVDPLELIDEFGADSLRFTLASMASPGTDMALARDRLAGYRAFCNKLWNASRFVLMNLGERHESEQAVADAAHPVATTLADKWILSRIAGLLPAYEENLAKYRFDEASLGLYHFIWHELCDWYIEMAKLTLWSEDPTALRSTRATLMAALETSLKALHPIMPFITEEIWSRLPGDRDLLCVSAWPHAPAIWRDADADARVTELQALVTELRRLRHDFDIPPGKKVPVDLVCPDGARRAELEQISDYIGLLAKAEPVRLRGVDDDIGEGIHVPVGDVEAVLLIGDVIDVKAETARLHGKLEAVEKDLEGLQGRLSNEGFVNNAPEEVVAKVRARAEELTGEAERLRQHLASLGD